MSDGRGLLDFLRDCLQVRRHAPHPRYDASGTKWAALVERLASTEWELLALWGDRLSVSVVLRDPEDGAIAVVSRETIDGRYGSLGAVRPGAIRMERAASELVGLAPIGLPDTRPWLDHGRWPVRRPLAPVPESSPPAAPPPAYPFLAAEGDGLHQIPVGPVHAGIIEPGHFRFTVNGETVVRLEERFGYAHKGIERLMQGKDIGEAARLAARLSGDSTVAHSLAFARAVEAALVVAVPPRAHYLRALMAELERLANHIGDFGAICNDAAFAFIHAGATALREDVLRAAARAFGHRLMMDRVVPGGVAADLDEAGVEAIRLMIRRVGPRFQALFETYARKPSLLDRMLGTGIVLPQLAQRFAAGGFVGRASGRGFDARKSPGYPPYDDLEFDVPVLQEGDVHSRVLVRAREIAESLKLVAQILDKLPAGGTRVGVVPGSGEGLGLVEGFRGDIVTAVRLASDGTVQRCHPRDPSWLQWPLLEAAVEDNIVADFPLCNKSFNCSYSGHDL